MSPRARISPAQVGRQNGEHAKSVLRREKKDARHPRSFLDPLTNRRWFWADEMAAYNQLREAEFRAGQVAEQSLETAKQLVADGLGTDVEAIATALIRKQLGKNATATA
jgi:hypothetical protein